MPKSKDSRAPHRHTRGSGVLLHVTSLPSFYGIGDIGPAAYEFVDFLAGAKQKYWQVLPLNPTDQALGNSPYSSHAAFAVNPLLISPDLLMRDGLLTSADCSGRLHLSEGQVDYAAVDEYKKQLFIRAYQNFKSGKRRMKQYDDFCSRHSGWLDDYALFVVLKAHYNASSWNLWPAALRDRDVIAVQEFSQQWIDAINQQKFLQYIFFQQWEELHKYCATKKIRLIGDMPIYVSYDSVDVWSHPELFKLDKDKRPIVVAGVPPDYFSENGQLWGNPVYAWDIMRDDGYQWWTRRIEHSLSLHDIVRIDHFRGFVGYWQIPVEATTAKSGTWVKAPAEDFFTKLLQRFHPSRIIAEDLGIITDDVREIMKRFHFAGMKVLLFAFTEDNPKHPYLPHNYHAHCVVYTGTHDNNTVRGWFDGEATDGEKQRLFQYLGRTVSAEGLHWVFVGLAMDSKADIALVPAQDLLGLSQDARMNIPSTTQGNWRWRLKPAELSVTVRKKLQKMARSTRRA